MDELGKASESRNENAQWSLLAPDKSVPGRRRSILDFKRKERKGVAVFCLLLLSPLLGLDQSEGGKAERTNQDRLS